MFRTTGIAIVLAFLAAPVLAAQAEPSGAAVDANAGLIVFTSDTAWLRAPSPIGSPDHAASRGAVLPVLYVALGALNFYDGYSTQAALSHGAVELNPAMRGLAGHSAALWAVKGGTTALSIYMAERLWKKGHRAQAIAVMVVSNGMMAAVAARNASVLRQVR